jgi:anti-sigma-K factor RskA
MNCLYQSKQGTEILLDYAAGTLDAERAAALQQHAAECSDCRSLLAAQKNVWTALDELEAPEVSGDFDARLYARIAREDANPSWKRSLETWFRGFAPGGISWKPVMACGAAAAVLAIGLAVRMPQPQESAAQVGVENHAESRLESTDAERVEVSLEDLEILTPPTTSAAKTSAEKM